MIWIVVAFGVALVLVGWFVLAYRDFAGRDDWGGP